MFRKIKLYGVATYTEPVEIELKDINFIYGGNGTGKTTLSKVISGELTSPQCCLETVATPNERILVYNKSFVEKNFKAADDIAGIFTLGKDSKETLEEVERLEAALQGVREDQDKIDKKITNLEEKRGENRIGFDELCWNTKVKFEKDFPDSLAGTRGSKRAFSDRCLEEYKRYDKDKSVDIEDIKKLYTSAYSKSAATYSKYNSIDGDAASSIERNELFEKKITGKADNDIGRFIEYLGASDWVKEGLALSTKSDGKCPYCQRELPNNIRTDIEDFFDEGYKRECAQISQMSRAYAEIYANTVRQMEKILSESYPILSYAEFESALEKYKMYAEKNIELINDKAHNPSTEIKLEDTRSFLVEINEQIRVFNIEIEKNNKVVESRKESRGECDAAVWQLIISELKREIAQYTKQDGGLSRGIQNVKERKEDSYNKAKELAKKIQEKKASISNVDETVNAINRILEGYGFTGFKLAKNESTPGTYKILRSDGSDAKESLSEGEYNFITFLYFYHLVFGESESGTVAGKKVIVIDDPISSLDSNVLFIVSSLVRRIISFCRKSEYLVEQVIVLTHNVYFHKEITYCGNRDHWPETRTAFFVVRKKNNVSSIEIYKENPIQSSYDMLWGELRDKEKTSAKSAFNIMRRILENYFNIAGGLDYEKCIDDFEGEDKLICKSLISCINEQSHTIADDLFMCIEDSELEHYLRVFREIFEKMGHLSHYDMMMANRDN